MASVFTKFFPAGFRLINGQALNNWFNSPQVSYENGITARAGGGQANATVLSARQSRISVCATNGDSVKLPQTSLNVGGAMVVINDGAANLAVFPNGNATIDGGAAAASVTVSAGKRAIFWTEATGAWQSGRMDKTT